MKIAGATGTGEERTVCEVGMGDLSGSVVLFCFQQQAAYEILLGLVGSDMCIRDGG